jgi:predicted transcriptional regulator
VGIQELTARERQVLYGLVRWPHLNDVELSGKLGLVRTTVTVVRQRLERNGLVYTVLQPDFGRVGCELLTALYGEFVGSASRDLESFKKAVHDGVSSSFYMVRHGGQHLSFGAAENLTKVREGICAHHRVHHESGYLTDKRHNYVFFPLKLTQIPRFFDYAPLLAKELGLHHEPFEGAGECSSGGWKPTRREFNVFKALVSHPTESDDYVAKKAQVSRQTVNILRNRFLKEGLLKPLRIPDVRKLGFGLMAFTHLHMNPHLGLSERSEHTKAVLDDPAHVLKVSGDLETVMLSVYPDYGTYKRSHDNLIKVYSRDRMLSDEPVVKLFPLAETDHIIHHDYGNVIID